MADSYRRVPKTLYDCSLKPQGGRWRLAHHSGIIGLAKWFSPWTYYKTGEHHWIQTTLCHLLQHAHAPVPGSVPGFWYLLFYYYQKYVCKSWTSCCCKCCIAYTCSLPRSWAVLLGTVKRNKLTFWEIHVIAILWRGKWAHWYHSWCVSSKTLQNTKVNMCIS